MKELTFGSMFAGIGGIDLAFINAGFTPVWANEMDKKAIETFKANLSTKLVEGRIEDAKEGEFTEVTVITAGFPCQAFSIAGLQKGFNDKDRGNLFFEIMKLSDRLSPEVLFLENVKNLIHHDKGRTFEVILSHLDRRGYHVKHQVLASDVEGGIPQGRKRIFIVCFQDKKAYDEFLFPEPIPLKVKPVSLISPTADAKYYYKNTKYYPMLLEEMSLDFNAVYQLRRKYVRKNQSGVCPTLTANAGKGGHNVPLVWDEVDIRKLTPREMLKFQGFPDDFIIPSGMADCHIYCQAGNSVTVPLVERIAKNIHSALKFSNG